MLAPGSVRLAHHRRRVDVIDVLSSSKAEVAEPVDAPDSKSGGRKVVWVRVPPSALRWLRGNPFGAPNAPGERAGYVRVQNFNPWRRCWHARGAARGPPSAHACTARTHPTVRASAMPGPPPVYGFGLPEAAGAAGRVECACPRGGSYPLFHHSVTSCSRWVRLAWRLRGKGRRPSEARLAPRLGSPVGSQRRTGGAASALVRESPSGGSWWYDETGERNGTSGVSELRRSHAA